MSLPEEWVSIAKKELGDKNSLETLVRKWDQFSINPCYTQKDLAIKGINAITDRLTFPYGAPNHWFNLPDVDCSSTPDANSVILEHLQNGADGIIIKVAPNTEPERILQNIKPEFCFLGFEADSASLSFFEKLEGLVSGSELNGVIYWTGKPNWLSIGTLFKGFESFRCFGVNETGNGVHEQLSNMINNAIAVLDTLTDYAFSVQSIFNQLAFTLYSTSNFFGDAIRVRALRILLQRLAKAYGLNSANSFIRMRINPPVPDQYQPHGDLLANTFAFIAAVVSSVDAITTTTLSDQSALHRRTARNISLLLKEESKLDKVIDPLAGSYFVESLTDQLVEKVWNQLITK